MGCAVTPPPRQTWTVAAPSMKADGLVVFYEQSDHWHVLPETQLSSFNAAICNNSGAPAAWSSPVEGPAVALDGWRLHSLRMYLSWAFRARGVYHPCQFRRCVPG